MHQRRCFHRFVDYLWYCGHPWGPRALQWPTRWPLGVDLERLWRPLGVHGPMFIDFSTPRSGIEKSTFFAITQNRPQSSKNHLLGAQGSIFDGFLTIFGDHFNIIFWCFCKTPKPWCLETVLQILYFLASQNTYFRHHFSSIFPRFLWKPSWINFLLIFGQFLNKNVNF